MSKHLELFKEIASRNGVDVVAYPDVEPRLKKIAYDGSDYFHAENVSVVRALAASAKEASAIIDVSELEKLECVIDTDELLIIIDKEKIFGSMYEAYREAFKHQPSNYMLFVSQESKTADIEKQLVSGVQGAKKVEFVIT